MVCINKKIGVLPEGRLFKAMKSSTYILSGENNIVLADQSVHKVAQVANQNPSSGMCLNHNALPVTQLDYKSENVSEISINQQRLQNCNGLRCSSQCKLQKWHFGSCVETQKMP